MEKITPIFPLHTLPSPKYIKTAVQYNLGANTARGNGNRAKRRAGLPVIDPSTLGPWGGIGMNTAQIVRMMRTAPGKNF